MYLFKKFLCAWVAVCILICSTTVFGNPPTENLVLYWNFNEGSGTIVADSSVSGYDGASTGGVTWVDGAKEELGTAVKINNGGVRRASSTGIIQNSPVLTVAAWIYTTGTQSGTDNATIISFGIDSNNNGSTSLSFGVTPAKKLTLGSRTRGGGTSRSLVSDNEIPMNEWIHVAGVIDYVTPSITLYINGEKVKHSVVSAFDDKKAVNSTSGRLAVGSGPHDSLANASTFKGSIDEVRIYRSALSDNDIEELYLYPKTENTDFTVEGFNFDATKLENGGRVTAKLTFQNNTGTEVPAKLIMALYDSKMKLKQVSLSEADVAGIDDDELTVTMVLPDLENENDIKKYTLKAFAWNAIDGEDALVPFLPAIKIKPDAG